jgi:hypothetical protein
MVKTTIRWGGLTLAAGSLLLAAGIALRSLQATNGLPTPLETMMLLMASILIIVALPGMYACQSEAAGWLGLVGHVLLEAGMLPVVVYAAAPLFYPEIKGPPSPNTGAILLGTAWLLGLVLTAVATLRAGVYPRWPGILLLAAGVGFIFVFSIGEGLLGIATQLGTAISGMLFVSAFTWIGLSIWTSPRGHNMAGSPEGVRPAV